MNEDSEIERVYSFELLGIQPARSHLEGAYKEDYKVHLPYVAYTGTLQTLHTFSYTQAEALVLSKIDYGNTVFHGSPLLDENALKDPKRDCKFCDEQVQVYTWCMVSTQMAASFKAYRILSCQTRLEISEQFWLAEVPPNESTRSDTNAIKKHSWCLMLFNIENTFGARAPKTLNENILFDKTMAKSFSRYLVSLPITLINL